FIFGGSGRTTDLARNAVGDTALTGHAHDADVIAGDNADIYKLVGTNGTSSGAFLVYNAIDTNVIYDANNAVRVDTPSERVIPRAITFLDYSPTGDAAYSSCDPATALNGSPANCTVVN